MFLASVKNAIDKLEQIDPNDEYAYEKAILAYTMVKQLPVFIYEDQPGLKIFRCRTHSDNNLFHSIDDIFITPSDYIKSFARCNKPQQSLFYCSENRPTSYMELLEYWASTIKFGDKLNVTIGRWNLKKVMRSIIVTTPHKDQRTSQYDKYYGEILDDALSQYNGDDLEANKIFYEYLTSKFRKPAKNDLKTYIITTAYCNLAFAHAGGKADAICYPSVPAKYEGVNWAISSKFSDYNNLELTHAMRDEFTSFENELKKHDFKQTGLTKSNSIDIPNKKIIWEDAIKV